MNADRLDKLVSAGDLRKKTLRVIAGARDNNALVKQIESSLDELERRLTKLEASFRADAKLDEPALEIAELAERFMLQQGMRK